jgi:LDH2 family malate/lactate/ureidoglycolate dehydrogenase
MADKYLVFPCDTLRRFAEDLLTAVGVPAPKAALVADTLIAANLRGVDTHGVQLLAFYTGRLAKGEIDPLADGCVASESGGCLLYDGQNGLGQVISEICCGHAVRLAREHGIAMVSVRNSNHFGCASYWALKIASEGALGMVMCNSSAIVPPWQGREGRLGTNPICLAVPGDDGRPWLLDMATTTVAAGKVFKAYLNKEPSIPSGWAMDSSGGPTTDTRAAYEGGLLMPLGGYKGYGLAMLVEILCAVISGGAMSTEVGGIRTPGAARTGQMFLAIEAGRFLPVDELQARMRWLVERMKSAAPAAGYDEVLVAGDPEWRSEERRRTEGIPVPDGVWANLAAEGVRLKVPAPQGAPLGGS